MQHQCVTSGVPTGSDDFDALIGAANPTLDSLAAIPRWVAWREELREGKPTKVPYQPGRNSKAQSTNPATWGTRDRARQRSDALSGNGVGIVLGSAEGLTLGGLDLDSCRNPETGALETWASEAIEQFGSYAEVSPSGAGVKVFFSYRPEDAAAVSDKARVAFSRGEHCEMALDLSARYYAVTGQQLEGAPAAIRPVALDKLTWFVQQAGPAFKGQSTSTKRDRSAEAYAIGRDIHRLGGNRAHFEAELAKDSALSTWAKDPRQVDRAWENSRCESFDEVEVAQPEPSRLQFLTPAECEASPSRGYVVKGLLAPRDVGCIYGAPGAGKSLISPHIGYCVALGSLAFGMRTRTGPVFYVAPEDPHGLRGRIGALRKRYGDAPEFKLVDGVTNLLKPDSPDLKALRAAIAEQRPCLIFLDTLAAAFPALEENSAEDMSRVVSIARSLTKHGAAVVLIHHDTKAQTPTPRGHSVLNGALDVALQLFPKDANGIVRGSLTKNRNGSCDLDIAFRIALQDWGDDEDGDPIRLPLVDELSGPAPRRERLPPSAAAALAELGELRGESNEPVSEDAWRSACIDGRKVSASDKPDNRRRAADRAIAELARRGVVDVRDGMASMAGDSDPNAFDEVEL